jgi:endonuclease YncB( thermonuclease family)
MRWVRLALASVILALGVEVGTVAAQAPFSGIVTQVVDGDTLCVGSIEVRLEGIDAPEKSEKCWRELRRWPCGPPATQALQSMAMGHAITCQAKYCDSRGRTVALCRLNGADLSEVMVSAGWAVDWPYFSDGAYLQAQQDARKAGRGLWANGGRPTLRMQTRMFSFDSRPNGGPWPPCKKRCASFLLRAMAN